MKIIASGQSPSDSGNAVVKKRKMYNFKHSLGYSGHNQITCLLISLLDLCASGSRLSFQPQCELAS
jgi:hypothetical protein